MHRATGEMQSERKFTLETELTAPSVEGLAVSVSFISNTGRLADAGALDCVARGLSLFAVLEGGFWGLVALDLGLCWTGYSYREQKK